MTRLRLTVIILANALITAVTVLAVVTVFHLWNDHRLFHQIVDLLSRPQQIAQPVTPATPTVSTVPK